jgi:hypothetical protein
MLICHGKVRVNQASSLELIIKSYLLPWDGDVNQNELNEWIDLLEENKISFIAWNVEAKAESCSILKTSANWDEMTDCGKYLKTLLTSKQETS